MKESLPDKLRQVYFWKKS